MSAAFQPIQVTRSCEQLLEAPPERILPLLTPRGEEAWAVGWRPEVLFDGDPIGTVFLTRHPADPATLWRMEAYGPEGVRYVRITPGLVATELCVTLAAEGTNQTRATVRYTFTGLSEAGNARAAKETPAHYAQWIGEWETELNHFLRTGSRLDG